MGRIQFWLTQGKTRLQLPVNPASVSVSSPYGFEDVNVARLGEITIFGERGQREISFETFFPRNYNVTYCEYTRVPAPATAVATIEKMRASRKPIRFNITGTKVSYNVTIREFEIEPERAASPGDIYFSMTLKEYREVTVKKIDAKKKTSSKQRPSSSKAPKPKTYTVKRGDNLWKIAKRYYGSGSKWPKIYNANKKVIGKNPNLIYPGQKLVIPSD